MVNKLYPYDVGKLVARDHTTGGAEPVRNFKRRSRHPSGKAACGAKRQFYTQPWMMP
jgi:hypothetical protein